MPTGVMILLPTEPTLDEMIEAGGEIVEHAESHSICSGFFFGSGQIERVTDYEKGLPGHHSFYGDDAQPDPLIMDERHIAACVEGRGVPAAAPLAVSPRPMLHRSARGARSTLNGPSP